MPVVLLIKMSMEVAGILFSGHMVASRPVSARVSKCKEGWLGKLAAECVLYIKRGGPRIPLSKRCCNGVKKADTSCLCGKLPPYFGKIFSVDKMLYVLRFCGKPLKPGAKCRNDKVPPPPPEA